MYTAQTITFAEKLLRTHSTRTSWRMRDTSARKKQQHMSSPVMAAGHVYPLRT